MSLRKRGSIWWLDIRASNGERIRESTGIHDFRWHDLRHTWASWHVQQGTPLHALQELGGWESAEMVRRYAHLSAEHLAAYADRLNALRDSER